MSKVLDLAQELALEDIEVPVAALIVRDGQVIAEAKNNREATKSVLGHAEIQAIQTAAKALGDWNLSDCTLYVNLEPCPMCAGAILQSHISKVVYSLPEPKSGAFGSRYNLSNKNLVVISSILEAQSKLILQKFFEKRR